MTTFSLPPGLVDRNSAGPIVAEQEAADLIARRDWRAMSARLASLPPASEYRFVIIGQLANAAAKDDSWLWEWAAYEPANTSMLAVQINYVVSVAWDVRTSSSADKVNREQWRTFKRTLRNATVMFGRATVAGPADPAPMIAMQGAALGLQWEVEQYRALLAKVAPLAPHSFTSHIRAMNFLRPRWYGSKEVMQEYVEQAIAGAPTGAALSMLRIQMLYSEFRPKGDAAIAEFYRADRFNQALNAAIADAAATDPAHPKLPYLRHWLAFGLWKAGRLAEAATQFQALGDYCGADPWSYFKDESGTFEKARKDCYERKA